MSPLTDRLVLWIDVDTVGLYIYVNIAPFEQITVMCVCIV